MKKVENYLETLKLKKCLFGGIAPKQIEIVIQEICMLYDLELYNKNNELEQERKKNEQQDIRMEKVAEYVRHDDCNLAAAQFCCLDKVIRRPAVHAHLVAHCLLAAHTEDFSQICLLLPCHGKQPLDDVRHCHVFIHSFHV